MIPSHTVSLRFYFPFYSRGSDRNCPGQFFPRYCTPRHVLCSSPLPLRFINGGGLCYHRRLRTLISPIHRVHSRPNVSQNPLYNYICWGKPDVLPSTLLRPIRDTTTILRLPRCIHSMKYNLFNRVIYLTNCSNANNFYNLRGLCFET